MFHELTRKYYQVISNENLLNKNRGSTETNFELDFCSKKGPRGGVSPVITGTCPEKSRFQSDEALPKSVYPGKIEFKAIAIPDQGLYIL